MTDRADVRFPPPLVFLGFPLLGPLADRLLGIAPIPVPWPLGAAIMAAGCVPIALALAPFRRTGQDPAPWASTPSIIETGIYARTRNPMYLGMAVMAAGLGLLLDSATATVLALVAAVVVDRFVIRREEAYLADKFGEAYLGYRRRVRRWL